VVSVTQASHGLAVGDVIRYNGSAYVEAQANTESNAEAIGIVDSVNGNDFTYVTAGHITGLSGLTAGGVHYLSGATAGLLTATEPSTVGQISKPLLLGTSTTAGDVFNMRGAVIAGAGGGIWKTFGIDSDASGPILNVTVGNGTMVGKWWTPAPVVAALATDPFLCIYYAYFTLGTTSSIDATPEVALPTDVDGSGLFLLAVPGINYQPIGGSAYEDGGSMHGAVMKGFRPTTDAGTEWSSTVPFTWGVGDRMVFQSTFLAQFISD